MSENPVTPEQIPPASLTSPSATSGQGQATGAITLLDCLSPILMLLLFMWSASLSFGAAISLALFGAATPNVPGWWVSMYNIGVSLAVGLPALLMGIFWPSPRYKGVFRAWAAAAGLVLLLALVGAVPATSAQAQALARILLSGLFTLILLVSTRLNSSRPSSNINKDARPSPVRARALLAAGIGVMVGLPWIAWGALGSLLDTFLQLLSALSLGLAGAMILEIFLMPHLRQHAASREGFDLLVDFLLAGFAAGVVLHLLAAGTGFPYWIMQLLLMFCLPALGWTAAGLAGLKEPLQKPAPLLALPTTLLLGSALALPLMFIDADELLLVASLSPGELLSWSWQAALGMLLLNLLSSLPLLVGLLVPRKQPAFSNAVPLMSISQVRQVAPLVSGVGLLAVLALAAGIYFAAGQPGLYGEGLFVILKDQADLSQAASQFPEYNARRQFVYATLVQHADTTQAELRQQFERLGLDYQPYYLVNAIQVQGGPLLRLWLTTRPEVDRILDNPWLRPLPKIPPISEGYESLPNTPDWNLTLIGADQVWSELGVTGEGVVVGQSDSGAQGDHPEIAAGYRGRSGGPLPGGQYNWFDPWYHTANPTDLGGHGTHTLGSVLGQKVGVAPGAQWIGCVNLARNLANPALYLDCMQFMLAPFPQDGDPLKDGKPELGAMVLNNSWGCPTLEGCDPNALLAGVRALKAAGVFVVASAGNDGPGCSSLNAPLALYEDVFSVGAIDAFGELANFSSLGPVTVDGSNRIKPDIVAPGVNVLSSMPGSTYQSNSGTSMAGPHVVGVVALMWSANPALIGQVERTAQILRDTARPFQGSLPACANASDTPSSAVGYGIVDAYAAVKAAMAAR